MSAGTPAKPHVVAGIFARGGSKGLPGKNVRLLGGKPLIAHAIEAARASKWIDRVFVSTDDAEIARVAAAHGAEVPFTRPAELAQDDSPEWSAWQHAIRTLQGEGARPWDVFACVPATCPLRAPEDIDRCIEALLTSDADIVITVRPAERNPYFSMVTLDEHGFARLAIEPTRATFRRQDAPAVYDISPVAYVTRPAFVLSSTSMFQGRVRAVPVAPERGIDIDTELDFAVAECLLRRSVAGR